MSTEERIIEVMGITAHLVVTDANAALAERAVERLHELETRWSPRLLPELRDAGYDRSFELIGVAGAAGEASPKSPHTEAFQCGHRHDSVNAFCAQRRVDDGPFGAAIDDGPRRTFLMVRAPRYEKSQSVPLRVAVLNASHPGRTGSQ